MPYFSRGRTTLVVVFCSVVTAASMAAPFTPASDQDVVERLPLRATDPSVRRVESLRKQLAAQPGNATLRLDIARRYFDLSMAQGDPRYVGYAAAALLPLDRQPPTDASGAPYWLLKGMLQQYSHDFDAALQSLEKSLSLAPKAADPMAWRAAIYMVQARYGEALAECERMAPLVMDLMGAGCKAYVLATTGQLQNAYDALQAALRAEKQAPDGLLLWERTRLAEMAWRLGRHTEAEGHFRAALALGVTDQFLLGAYADFLLERGRPREVITLLSDWERSDILLLRLALAGPPAQDARAKDWATQLRERFAAAALRGDRLHEQEAARFELDIEKRPAAALALAVRNYGSQKEPRDAQILLRAALAAGDAKAAAPALAWLQSSRHEDAALAQLAGQLAQAGARP